MKPTTTIGDAMDAVRKYMDARDAIPGLSVEAWKGSQLHLLFLAAAALVCLEDAIAEGRAQPDDEVAP